MLVKTGSYIFTDGQIKESEINELAVSGCEADIETDGVSGLNTALKGGYDLILLDIMLPKMDGFSVCRRLR